MSAVRFEVTSQRLMRGCAGDLNEKTALVDLDVDGHVPHDAAAEQRFRQRAAVLCPEPGLLGARESDWPTAFLTDTSLLVDDHAGWLGRWVVALTVAIQQWANDAVWSGSVLVVEPGQLRLAVGYQRADLFNGAFGVATRLVQGWLAQPESSESLDNLFDGRWADFADGGLVRQTQRLMRAAFDRGIPSDVLPSFIQIGWGAAAERFDVTYTGHTSWIAGALSGNAYKTNRTLADALVPVPRIWWATDAESARAGAEELGWPVTVKAVTHGSEFGPVTGIADPAALNQAVTEATAADIGDLLIEKQPPGALHRVLVARNRVLAAVRYPSAAHGTPRDVSADIHPDNVDLALRAARVIGLDLAAVELSSPDITHSWREVGGAVNDVRARPDLDPYRLAGVGRDLEGEIFDCLGLGRSARIPTAAITGTNGKTTTTAMLHRIWSTAGRLTGMCTTEHVVIGDDIVVIDNLSGHPGARMILNDPGVQAAAFEMPRKGLIYFGHPCDRYDVGALLNVQDDHIGVDGIETLQQMAELKAEVLTRARHAAVVNADDPLCVAMLTRAGTDRHILVSGSPDNPVVAGHRRSGGEAAYIDVRDGRRCIVLATGDGDEVLMALNDVPATRNGLLRFNETNAMFAAAIAWAQGLDRQVIRAGLGSFNNSRDDDLGRYNFIEDLPFQLLLDFAHNPDGVREICAITAALPVSGRRLLCSLNVGSRHPRHVDRLAPAIADTFDDIVFGCDPREVARQPEYAGEDPAHTMLARSARLLEGCGVPPDRITTQPDPAEAIRAALRRAQPGDLVVVLAEPYQALPVIDEFRRVPGG